MRPQPQTFAGGEGAFLANRSGPVRAIRSFLGANSGPMTEHQQIFYEGREEDTTFLRVHLIPGVMSFLDYSAAAAGMTYRNNNNLGGVTVDGAADSVAAGPLTWESMDGAQGTLTSVHTWSTTVAPSKFTSFYRDLASPPAAPCQGDGGFYGASGPSVNGLIGSTDEPPDGTAPSDRLTSTRTMFFDAPGAAGGAPLRRQQVASRLTTNVDPPPASRLRRWSRPQRRPSSRHHPHPHAGQAGGQAVAARALSARTWLPATGRGAHAGGHGPRPGAASRARLPLEEAGHRPGAAVQARRHEEAPAWAPPRSRAGRRQAARRKARDGHQPSARPLLRSVRTTPGVQLVDGIHHVTFLTEDMDRLLAFYERVFDAEVTLDMTEDGIRHAFLVVGPTTVLHPFQLPEEMAPPPPSPMFSRGRLDHFALLAPSEEAFRELRRRIEAEGAADGDVRDMKSLWIMGYFDPDGAAHEVMLRRPGTVDADVLERAEWTTVTLG